MMARLTITASLLLLAACGTSPELRSMDNASRNTASRIWTQPQVARAINVRATVVSDFNPGVNILVNNIPQSLGTATYGAFDSFDTVLFDTKLASHADVQAGMRRYCATLQRDLVQVRQGVMQVPPNQTGLIPYGWTSGACR